LKSLSRYIALGALVAAIGVTQVSSAQAEQVDLNVLLPGVAVNDVTVLGPSEATVQATVDPNGLATTLFVEYGTDGILDQRTPVISVNAALEPVEVLLQLLGLEPGTSYSYRVVVENPAGTTTTPTTTLTTPATSGTSRTSIVFVDLGTGQRTSSAGANKARCTVVGTPRRDNLRGTSRRDVICGFGGNDRLRGLGGNDLVVGGSGKDRIFGGKGRDRLLGNKGADRLNARDRKRGDRVDGGTGRDKVFVDKGDRVIASESVSRR
jgi:Ca2+-binding RTX toxin-like protein